MSVAFPIGGGFGFAFFYGLVVKATAPEFGGTGTLSPYQAVFFFTVAVLISTLFLNPIVMKTSVEGKATMKDYFKNGDTCTHLIGMLGGFIWKEFKDAPKGTNKYVAAMFISFLVALILITLSN